VTAAPVGPTLDSVQVGDVLPPYEFRIERLDLVRYAGASGDFNAIHWSDAGARAAGLPDVIAHGMLTMARSVNGVVAWLGDPTAVVEYGVRFVRPVVVPVGGSATVSVTSQVTEKLDDRHARVELTVTCEGQRVLGRAEAIVRLPATRDEHEMSQR
jgi:acyl dehydratase